MYIKKILWKTEAKFWKVVPLCLSLLLTPYNNLFTFCMLLSGTKGQLAARRTWVQQKYLHKRNGRIQRFSLPDIGASWHSWKAYPTHFVSWFLCLHFQVSSRKLNATPQIYWTVKTFCFALNLKMKIADFRWNDKRYGLWKHAQCKFKLKKVFNCRVIW